jgi:transporter family protein
MRLQPWLVYALLSALAASFVAIFGKVGMKQVDSNLATAVRSVVMTLFLLAVCSVMGLWSKLGTISGKALGIIVLSGVAGAVSWLFYFRAIKLSMPLAVLLAVLLLGDRPTGWNWFGVALIALGGYFAALPRPQ